MMALPQTEERDHFGSPSYRVNGKIFAQLSASQKKEQRALVKLSSADQAALTLSHPDTFSPAPHWGRHGWTYIELASIQKSIFEDVLFSSWRQIAPKRLVASYLGLEKSR
ncbi:MAG: MmcQ/YjbR family DNA-binding protein [Proteobacteria bacterium]|nr:MmcQ/YjbR family DNA-binding protein [Pseudomonadota bacterium]